VVTAGFPCQDLSQVGRRKGISGPNSGLIQVLLRLLEDKKNSPEWVVLENVPFMLTLEGGSAIRFITSALESMGFAWAYRTVNAMSFGLPQRRRRVLLLASRDHDPRPVLLGQDSEPPVVRSRGAHACGFYWTEGNTGLGWAVDAIPPLKGGSALHIPSPPAIWFPRRRLIATPLIEDAERLQGFEAGWTASATDASRESRGKRWRMVGNAVSVPMARWIAERLLEQPRKFAAADNELLPSSGGWPGAAWAYKGIRCKSVASEWPVATARQHLAPYLKHDVTPLSKRATLGFLSRLKNSGLNYDPAFAEDLAYHAKNV
jgi:DNA (cytosine-5)-methyltransferase 1